MESLNVLFGIAVGMFLHSATRWLVRSPAAWRVACALDAYGSVHGVLCLAAAGECAHRIRRCASAARVMTRASGCYS